MLQNSLEGLGLVCLSRMVCARLGLGLGVRVRDSCWG